LNQKSMMNGKKLLENEKKEIVKKNKIKTFGVVQCGTKSDLENYVELIIYGRSYLVARIGVTVKIEWFQKNPKDGSVSLVTFGRQRFSILSLTTKDEFVMAKVMILPIGPICDPKINPYSTSFNEFTFKYNSIQFLTDAVRKQCIGVIEKKCCL